MAFEKLDLDAVIITLMECQEEHKKLLEVYGEYGGATVHKLLREVEELRKLCFQKDHTIRDLKSCKSMLTMQLEGSQAMGDSKQMELEHYREELAKLEAKHQMVIEDLSRMKENRDQLAKMCQSLEDKVEIKAYIIREMRKGLEGLHQISNGHGNGKV